MGEKEETDTLLVNGKKRYCKTSVVKTKNKMCQKHSLLVCDEKDKVSLAKSSLLSNWSSFDLTQKLFSQRSSAVI